MNVLYISFVIVILDQVTKILVKGIELDSIGIKISGMMIGSSIPVLGDFFRITFVENPGMAFGIGVNSKTTFTILTIFVTLALFYYLYTLRNDLFYYRVALAFILGGAVGNMIDRVFYSVIFNGGEYFNGKVVDFIDIDFFDFSIYGLEINRWWIFNIADASVSLGIILILISGFILKKKEINSSSTNLTNSATQ